jgi:mono/diheme cytochrome c family protein
MRFLFRLFVLLLAVVAVATAVLWYVASRGVSARAQPTALEEAVAIRLRAFATPSDAKSARNPVSDSPAVIREGLEHFADHCALCHANDGSGHTELSEGLYPKPPDLRASRTQSLSDGELYYIIQNGVRFTGMPAFGDSHGAEETWHLVRFIRHLPSLTPDEVEAMKKLNPTSPAERDEEHAQHHHRE